MSWGLSREKTQQIDPKLKQSLSLELRAVSEQTPTKVYMSGFLSNFCSFLTKG